LQYCICAIHFLAISLGPKWWLTTVRNRNPTHPMRWGSMHASKKPRIPLGVGRDRGSGEGLNFCCSQCVSLFPPSSQYHHILSHMLCAKFDSCNLYMHPKCDNYNIYFWLPNQRGHHKRKRKNFGVRITYYQYESQ